MNESKKNTSYHHSDLTNICKECAAFDYNKYGSLLIKS